MSLKKAIPQTGQRKFFEFGKYKIHNSLSLLVVHPLLKLSIMQVWGKNNLKRVNDIIQKWKVLRWMKVYFLNLIEKVMDFILIHLEEFQKTNY